MFSLSEIIAMNAKPCDCGKGEWCPQYGSAFRAAKKEARAKNLPRFGADKRLAPVRVEQSQFPR